MYFYLVGALKRRLILELQNSFASHPVYRKITPYIQNRFSFAERPEFGIVVKGSSASKVQLDSSNFMGTIESRVMLAQVPDSEKTGHNVFPLEWVREDLVCVQQRGGMPTPSGVYYMEILSAPENAGESGSFIIDPLLTVTDEPVAKFGSGMETRGQLQAEPLVGTLRLYENRQFLLTEGSDYESLAGGEIRFLRPFSPSSYITADYRHPEESIGPVPFQWNTSNTTTLPGVVLAFGKRAEAGQKVAVVVYSDRVSAAQAFGGKTELSFDLDVVARDTTQSEEIADLVYMYLWAHKKPILEMEGIEILDVSIGGESEDAIDETGQNFQYTVSVSVQMRADWEVHVPLPLTIVRLEPNLSAAATTAYFDTVPVLPGRNADFERIG